MRKRPYSVPEFGQVKRLAIRFFKRTSISFMTASASRHGSPSCTRFSVRAAEATRSASRSSLFFKALTPCVGAPLPFYAWANLLKEKISTELCVRCTELPEPAAGLQA